MVKKALHDQLFEEGLIGELSYQKLQQNQDHPLFSVFQELNIALYLGVLLLTGGMGILVYKNIDSIGHGAVLAFIACISLGCFWYCFKNKAPFSFRHKQQQTAVFNYVLLLGTLSMLTFIGYLQYQYNVFGLNYGMATFIPMLALFFIAYDFDNVLVLNLALVNLALWMGVSVTPKNLLAAHTFDSQSAVYTYIAFSAVLYLLLAITNRYQLKKHFNFSYKHYAVLAGGASLVAGYILNISNNIPAVFYLFALAAFAILVCRDGLKQRSFYFILLGGLFGYIGLTTLIIHAMDMEHGAFVIMYYFIFSAVGGVWGLIHLYKKIEGK